MLRRAFDAKFWGHITTIQAALPNLAPDGSITLLGAITARTGMPGTAGIAAINGAVEALVKPLATELAPIRVNGVSPGFVDTPWWSGLPDEARDAFFAQAAQALPTRRIATAEDIADSPDCHRRRHCRRSRIRSDQSEHDRYGHRIRRRSAVGIHGLRVVALENLATPQADPRMTNGPGRVADRVNVHSADMHARRSTTLFRRRNQRAGDPRHLSTNSVTPPWKKPCESCAPMDSCSSPISHP